MSKWGIVLATILSLVSVQAMASAHIMMTKQAREKVAPSSILVNPEAALAHEMDYYGGQVLANVRVIGVFWGANVNSTVRTQMADFYGAFTVSAIAKQLSEYSTAGVTAINGHAGTNQTIVPGNYGGDFQITPKNTSTSLQDSDVQAEIAAQIASGALPAADSNTLYMVHFPPNVSITMQGATSCQDFCAYHGSYLDQSGKDVYYGVMPDFSTGACSVSSGGGCGSNSDFENFTAAASHEVSEAISDSQIADVTGENIDFPAAWYDVNDNMEIGDVCAYVSSGTVVSSQTGTSYSVQGEWSNAKNECYTGTN